ncbi:MAG: deoxyguanosinetriphosphate triphosphohydrolase [Verrucomicrobia bacterium]|nr:deoxyguanosinetriphosphate triphosphohydrolase [Verrucomicrobiota bacterium]
MMDSRKDREILEDGHLAPYAARCSTSYGRRHSEEEHMFRTAFQRDRDRIIHSPSFRRLEYKTQVFVNGTADHYRTRLTHTMEMTSIGRNIARTLRANEDLTETIALAHDIGHSPFGHVGERELDDLMKNEGGFDHNIQSLRWVELLENRYPAFPGLNLTWEVRAGLRKHLSHVKGAELDGRPIGPFQFIEGQIADVADDISYHAHDVEDGLEAGLLSLEMLNELELWRKAIEQADKDFPTMSESQRYVVAIRYTLELQVQDIIREATRRLEKYQPASPVDIMNAPERIVTFSSEMQSLLQPFRAFLFENVYWHPSVADANNEAVRMMRRLFLHYVEHPEAMGRKARARLEKEGLWRTACDYVSGMTDRYALAEYIRFGLDKE